MTDIPSIYRDQGLGGRIGFGRRPALLVIDFINGFNDTSQFGGGNIQAAIDATATLLAAARRHALPIAYTSHCYAGDGSDESLFNLKMPRMGEVLVAGSHAVRVVDQLSPLPGEYLINKHFPSGFFGTDLAGWLAARGVDTAIVSGCTTSGCVRATVVDALGHGFRPIVPRECVGDRAEAPHEANLFDMEQKYADVLPLAEVLTALDELFPAKRRNAG
jgi:maleamate amidohydrolase